MITHKYDTCDKITQNLVTVKRHFERTTSEN